MEKINVQICMGTSCYLLGAHAIIDYLESLPAKKKQHLEISGSTCLKACGKGPNVKINDELYTSVTPEKIKDLIDDLIDKL